MLRSITAMMLVTATAVPGLTHAAAEIPPPCAGVHIASTVWILDLDKNTCENVPPPAPYGMECTERGADIPPSGTLDFAVWICIPD
ncbi:MAG: hypothetical protein QOJ29_3866 [Thermoleophilaceae bacterium]|jgi:hypothetical protein|nr:hypothetical protein [Thermoleophilaceae bacterium]